MSAKVYLPSDWWYDVISCQFGSCNCLCSRNSKQITESVTVWDGVKKHVESIFASKLQKKKNQCGLIQWSMNLEKLNVIDLVFKWHERFNDRCESSSTIPHTAWVPQFGSDVHWTTFSLKRYNKLEV